MNVVRSPLFALALCSSALLTACPSPTPTPYVPPTGGSPRVGLAVGTTNSLSCIDFLGRKFDGPATAITLALRDSNGGVISSNSGQPINLVLEMPNGREFIFKNPYNPTIEDSSVFPASENYFVLCTSPLAGTYTLSGLVGGSTVSDNAFLENATPPALPSGGVNLDLKSARQTEVSWSRGSDEKVALVNYYRGRSRGGALEGYRIGSAVDAPPAVVITPDPPEEPQRTSSPSSEACSSRPTGKTPPPPAKKPVLGGNLDEPPTLSQTAFATCGGLSSSSLSSATLTPNSLSLRPGGFSTSLSFAASGSSAPTLRPQSGSGSLTVNLGKSGEYDYSHVQQQRYYAEVITSNLALGTATDPNSLSRNDLTVRYSAATPSGNLGGLLAARFSLTSSNLVRANSTAPYLSSTTSLLAPDGWPTVEDYTVSISGPGGTIGYPYPAFGAYALGLVPVTGNTAGTYTANFTTSGKSFSRTQSFVPNAPLDAPDATLKLNPDAQGFTLELPSSNLRHWLYVYRTSSPSTDPPVASQTLIPSEATRSGGNDRYTIPRANGQSLNSNETYAYYLYSTEAPLELFPLLYGTEWNFSQPIRWEVQLRYTTQPATVTLSASREAGRVGDSVTITIKTETSGSVPHILGLFESKDGANFVLVLDDQVSAPTATRTFTKTFTSAGRYEYAATIYDGTLTGESTRVIVNVAPSGKVEVTLSASSRAVLVGNSVTFSMETKTTESVSPKVTLFEGIKPNGAPLTVIPRVNVPTDTRTFTKTFTSAGEYRYFAAIEDGTNSAFSNEIIVSVAASATLGRLDVIPSKSVLVGENDALTLSVKGYDSSNNPFDLSGKTPFYNLSFVFPQDIVALEPSGRVRILNTNIGNFQVKGTVDGVSGQTARLDVNGVKCVPGPSGPNTLFLCNYLNQNGLATLKYPVTATAPNGQIFSFNQNVSNPILAATLVPSPVQQGVYRFSVTTDRTYTSTSSVSLAAPLIAPAGNLTVLAGSTNKLLKFSWTKPNDNTSTLVGYQPACVSGGGGEGGNFLVDCLTLPDFDRDTYYTSDSSIILALNSPLPNGCYEWQVRTTNFALKETGVTALPSQIGSGLARARFLVNGTAPLKGVCP